jgi:DnaK suppressor protein
MFKEIAMTPHLTAAQKAQLTADLEQRERQLREQLDFHLHGQSRVERAADVLGQDNDDPAQRRSEQAVSAALGEQERAELNAVVEALTLTKGGRFGLCRICGADIPFDRLRACPWATQCVTCAPG